MATISSCHTEAGMQGPWLSADETSSALQLLTAVRQLVVPERICLVLPLPDKEAPLSSLLGVFDAVCLETSQLHERSELVTPVLCGESGGRLLVATQLGVDLGEDRGELSVRTGVNGDRQSQRRARPRESRAVVGRCSRETRCQALGTRVRGGQDRRTPRVCA